MKQNESGEDKEFMRTAPLGRLLLKLALATVAGGRFTAGDSWLRRLAVSPSSASRPSACKNGLPPSA